MRHTLGSTLHGFSLWGNQRDGDWRKKSIKATSFLGHREGTCDLTPLHEPRGVAVPSSSLLDFRGRFPLMGWLSGTGRKRQSEADFVTGVIFMQGYSSS